MRRLRWLFVAVMLLCLAPLFSVFACMGIASITGCQVDEGSAHACLVMGYDIGGLLYTMGVMGWFMLMTLPVLVIAAVVWIAAEIVNARRKGRAA